MANFWACFKIINENLFRFDTRVYLQDIEKPLKDDLCIGAVIGKNPGSAQPTDIEINELQPIQLERDNFLPTIKSIITKSYRFYGNINIPSDSKNRYIQVLNLFYLCDSVLDNAIEKINGYTNHQICLTENFNFHFIYYAWGEPDARINNYKIRFLNNQCKNHIWYDQRNGIIKNTIPNSEVDFPRHTQGFEHRLIVPYIAKLLNNV